MSNQQHIVRVLALAAVVCGYAGAAKADVQQETVAASLQRIGESWPVEASTAGAGPRPEVYAQWSGLPPEQRQQMRQQMREHWQNMPPPEQRGYRQESRERWPQMPSEERQRMRDEMREQRGRPGWRDGERRFSR